MTISVKCGNFFNHLFTFTIRPIFPMDGTVGGYGAFLCSVIQKYLINTDNLPAHAGV